MFLPAWFLAIYTIMAFSYILYRQILYCFCYQQYQSDFSAPYSVIVPCYNEKPELLEKCVNSLLELEGQKEILIADDGSKNQGTLKYLKELQQNQEAQVFFFEHAGKRETQISAIQNAKNEYLVLIDSDTVVEKNSVTELLKPFADKKVGSVTGNVFVLNEQKNFLTKTIGARYWNAFNVERAGLGAFGVVNCCSGVLSAYKKTFVDSCTNEYANQRFLGKKCTYGDDRNLTNLALKAGYKTVYQPTAIAWTDAPENLKKLFIQQTRWRKSWFRETIILSKFVWKKSKLLALDTVFQWFLPFASILVRIMVWITILVWPQYVLFYALTVLLIASLRSMNCIFSSSQRFFYSLGYAALYETILFWCFPFALVTMNDLGWGTR